MKTKLFLGARITPDLKMRLFNIQMPPWSTIPFEGKEYVGIYINFPNPTVQMLRTLRQEFIESLQEYLPDFRTDTLPIVVFPQVFLG